MEEKLNFYDAVEEICIKDRRYKPDAYGFIMEALHYTQAKFNKDAHVSGKELLQGAKELVIQKYGVMSKTVLKRWGIATTMDFGNIVFNMIDSKLLAKTESDCVEDFKDVYNFETAFGNILKDIGIKNI